MGTVTSTRREEVPLRSLASRPRSYRLALLSLALAGLLALTGCSTTTAPPGGPAASAASGAARPVTVQPHESWSDAVLYFVIVDRFADGDKGNNNGVDRGAKGTFHGGDLAGLRQQLDERIGREVRRLYLFEAPRCDRMVAAVFARLHLETG